MISLVDLGSDYKPKIIMADDPDLLPKLKVHLTNDYVLNDGRTPLLHFRSLISSPRLAEYHVRERGKHGLCAVGDTFLSKHTILADGPQKTLAIELGEWKKNESMFEKVESYALRDGSVIKIQVWPFNPYKLNLPQLKVAVAVSYNEIELMRDSRLCGAIYELLSTYNVDADPLSR
ncbi:hypothetical protein [Pseudomonas viridiflava]|uniref:hypothetical protein n=1 Tax=Pseudomonas viridiflava TaxID=33069 RepID=UPI000F0110AD|nr:hypothetical protein [Pseudomonas viridiflava]